MRHINIPGGIKFEQLDSPAQSADVPIERVSPIQHIALRGQDFRQLQPDFAVSENDQVRCGQTLFSDRANPEIIFTASSSGTVKTIKTGRRRTLDILEIECNSEDGIRFDIPAKPVSYDGALKCLRDSGLWTTLRTRPYNRIPAPGTSPSHIFVTAIDTEPLAADPRIVLQHNTALFNEGVSLLGNLTEGRVYVCQSRGQALADTQHPAVENVSFSGKHLAGAAGSHIHALSPVGRHNLVWYINYQDVVAIGHLVQHGYLDATRVISLAGTGIQKPRLLRVPAGASLTELIHDETKSDKGSTISGSVVSGRQDTWLGHYDTQVTVMADASTSALPDSKLLRWLYDHLPGNTAIVPETWLENVSPLTSFMVPMLRALATRDLDAAEATGCLSFAAEDIAPLSILCPTGHDYAQLLNGCLDEIAHNVTEAAGV